MEISIDYSGNGVFGRGGQIMLGEAAILADLRSLRHPELVPSFAQASGKLTGKQMSPQPMLL